MRSYNYKQLVIINSCLMVCGFWIGGIFLCSLGAHTRSKGEPVNEKRYKTSKQQVTERGITTNNLATHYLIMGKSNKKVGLFSCINTKNKDTKCFKATTMYQWNSLIQESRSRNAGNNMLPNWEWFNALLSIMPLLSLNLRLVCSVYGDIVLVV